MTDAGESICKYTTAVAIGIALASKLVSAAGGQHCTEFVFTNGFDQPVPVTAFATTYDYFYRFDIADPGTVDVVSSSHITAFKLDYVGSDFTHAYGIDSFGITFNTFAEIDTATVEVIPIGMSYPSADNSELGSGIFSGFKYDNTTDTAYAVGTSCGSSAHLYTIDMATGAASVVGDLTGITCAGAIAIDATGAMYGIDYGRNALVAIDKSSGATTPIGYIGFDTHYTHDIDFNDTTGVLYYAGYNNYAQTDELRTLDLSTGESTLVGALATNHTVGLAIEASICGGVGALGTPHAR